MANPPTLAEIAAAMKVLQQPEPRSGIEKHITTIMTMGVFAIGAWALTGLNSMQQTVIQVSTTVAAMSKSIDEMSKDSKDGIAAQSALNERVGRLEQRIDGLDGGRGRNGQNNDAGSGARGPTPGI